MVTAKASYGNEVTVKQLLNHTSGIDVYANANYGLLGSIVEGVSGCSYADYISKNIFNKARMNYRNTSLDKAKENRLMW